MIGVNGLHNRFAKLRTIRLRDSAEVVHETGAGVENHAKMAGGREEPCRRGGCAQFPGEQFLGPPFPTVLTADLPETNQSANAVFILRLVARVVVVRRLPHNVQRAFVPGEQVYAAEHLGRGSRRQQWVV